MSNERLTAMMAVLLEDAFSQQIGEIHYHSPFGQITRLAFDGCTVSGKKFFGEIILSNDAFQVIEEVTIQTGGKYGKFSYCPESDPPFAGV